MNNPHKKLDAWASAIDLTQLAYQTTDHFPIKEQYGLSSQIRRAAASILSNIAEGAARHGKKEFLQFLHIARGSLSELDTQLELAKRLEYIDQNEWVTLNELLERFDKMLSGLIRHLGGKL
ncbi:MAG: four helix bundle protein [Nitrospira sp.]|nr:four helix bundle protein [Nitrospira sp.]